MPNTRKVIRAFLASPGDLGEERKAIRDVVDEFNDTWASELGYQIELVGWEKTVAGFGRPQSLINRDLEQCDLFLGMISKRWGTPPDLDDVYTSGFQEEFERSLARCEKTGSPEISLFFKEIPSEFLVDPGEDLKKVIAFKNEIIASKKVYFQTFFTVRDIEKLTRKSMTNHVNQARMEDASSEPDEVRAKRARTSSAELGEAERGRDASPLSDSGLQFLENLVERIRHPDSLEELTPSDIARFRLLANSISKPGNEQMSVGVHDINLVFTARYMGVELGRREKQSLVRLAFQHLDNENVPIWCWYSDLASPDLNPAVISSFFGADDEEKAGAISVLTALALDLHSIQGVVTRDEMLTAWFRDDSTTKVRTAALRYLAKCGTIEDLEVARNEFDKSDYGTSRSALECMVEILLRTGQKHKAQELALGSQFESLNTDLLHSLLSELEGLDTETLFVGLEHRNSQVRLCSLRTLCSREELDTARAEQLLRDSEVLVRSEAVNALIQLGNQYSKDEIKKILVSSQAQPRSGLFGLAIPESSDAVGRKLFEQYELVSMKNLSRKELKKIVETNSVFDDAPYFALTEMYFKDHADELRCNVKDRFCTYFEERIKRMEAEFGDSDSTKDLIKKTRDLEQYLRQDLTRKGLDILCAFHKPEDLPLIRSNLRDGYTEASILDAEYLRRHGEWADIPLLANAIFPTSSATNLLIVKDRGKFQLEVARAIVSIGKNYPISDLLALEMPVGILRRTIELCSESRFAKISQNTLFALFDHDSEEVRKAAALLAVRAFTARRIKSVLRDYVLGDKHRYYNVIHWLDLGASLSRGEAKTVAKSLRNSQ